MDRLKEGDLILASDTVQIGLGREGARKSDDHAIFHARDTPIAFPAGPKRQQMGCIRRAMKGELRGRAEALHHPVGNETPHAGNAYRSEEKPAELQSPMRNS